MRRNTALRRLAINVITGLIVLTSVASPVSLLAQTALPPNTTNKVAAEIINSMSVSQKVGQIFIVSFSGTDIAPTSDIADLITNYRVGGVLLQAENQNFTNDTNVTGQVVELTNNLQAIAMITQTTATAETTATVTAINPGKTKLPQNVEFVPLFVAINQEGDGAPYSAITRGLTQLPSQLAIGATWRIENAGTVGQIVGRELAQLGVNVLIGPVLDVMDEPSASSPDDIGTRVFGGDPYWVGRFGASYINGVHLGSDFRMAVVASRFPGLGSSDRSLKDEIPTVQKSLEQLKQIELAPFFAVTQLQNDQPITSTTDGLLVSHIRYRGFQGNIRASTRPVSLDPKAYQALMALPEIAPWRNAGGVTFSDMLGLRGVRRFYDPLDDTFNARRVAQEAFLAGNDVLQLGNFGLTNSWAEQLANIKDTILFFRERYVSDQTFAARVDASLARILSLKLKLYKGNLTSQNVIVNAFTARAISPNNDQMTAIAKDAVTLLSPAARDLTALTPSSTGRYERIVFITDDRQIKECNRCAAYAAIPRTALQDIALDLYGPKTTGQLNPQYISSFSFGDLAEYKIEAQRSREVTPTVATSTEPTVNTSATITDITAVVSVTATGEPLVVQNAIDNADLIVIAMLDMNSESRSTQLFREFLSQRADALRDKRVVVLAFGAPYHLDTTDISKLTAYFGIYSRIPAFQEAAVRALFGELPPNGASPVSVTALNYSLLSQTAPDPNQIIPLIASDPLTTTPPVEGSLEMKIGDKLRLRAGPVYDRNGHVVPDGTQIQFVLTYPVERVDLQQSSVSTRDGVAETTVVIERKGVLEIRAQADPALTSYMIRVNIGENAASIETIRPTAIPTVKPEPSPTVTERPTEPPTSVPTPTVVAQNPPQITRSSLGGFIVTALVLIVIALSAILVLNIVKRLSVGSRWRVVLLSWSAGWIAYILYVTGVPGTEQIAQMMGWYGSVIVATAIALLALLLGLVIILRSNMPSVNAAGGR